LLLLAMSSAGAVGALEGGPSLRLRRADGAPMAWQETHAAASAVLGVAEVRRGDVALDVDVARGDAAVWYVDVAVTREEEAEVIAAEIAGGLSWPVAVEVRWAQIQSRREAASRLQAWVLLAFVPALLSLALAGVVGHRRGLTQEELVATSRLLGWRSAELLWVAFFRVAATAVSGVVLGSVGALLVVSMGGVQQGARWLVAWEGEACAVGSGGGWALLSLWAGWVALVWLVAGLWAPWRASVRELWT